MSGLDWPGLMRAGLARANLGGLGLSPREFWGLTPAELMLMLGDPQTKVPLNRARLTELARAWPDRAGEKSDGGKDAGDGRTGRD
ncbi:MAG: phage tail assembly chaperone [Albidovulum sp.]